MFFIVLFFEFIQGKCKQALHRFPGTITRDSAIIGYSRHMKNGFKDVILNEVQWNEGTRLKADWRSNLIF